MAGQKVGYLVARSDELRVHWLVAMLVVCSVATMASMMVGTMVAKKVVC